MPPADLPTLEATLDAADTPVARLSALTTLALATTDHGDPARGLRLAQEALTLADSLDGLDDAYRARAVQCAGIAHMRLAQYPEAIAHMQACLELGERLGHLPLQATSLGMLGSLHQVTGNTAQALTAMERGLDVQRAMNDLDGEAVALNNLALVYEQLGEVQRGLELREASLALRRQQGEPARLALLLNNLGHSLLQLARHDAAQARLDEALDLARTTGNRLVEAYVQSNLAKVQEGRGRPDRAQPHRQEALTLAREVGDRSLEAELLSLLGEEQRAAGHLTEAQALLTRALEQYGAVGGQWGVASALLGLSKVHEAQGDLAGALARFQQYHELTRTLQGEEAERHARLLTARFETEAARREAELAQLENVELQRALEANARLIQSLRDSQQVSDTLLGVSHLTQLDLDPHDLARHALGLVTQVVDADWAALVRLVSHDVTVEPLWARHPAAETFTRRTLPGALDARHPLLHRAARSDEATFRSAYPHDPAAHPALVAAGLHGVASLPAGTTQATTFVLLLGRLGHDRRWTDREQHVLGATGRALRAAIETQEQTRRTREAALTDVLTGLPNRRAFEADLKDAGGAQGFSVAMLDVDGLKRVNDTRGHAAGDRLLQVFGAALRTHAPDGVRVYRLGGDELALLSTPELVPAPDAMDALVRALVAAGVQALRGAGFPEAGCSFGVARWPQEAATPVEVVALADTRLYADKQARRGPAVHARAREVHFGDAVLDVEGRGVRGALGEARLTPREAEMLYLLASGAPGVVTRAELSEGAAAEASGALDVHLSNLRRKLAGVTSHAGIRTVRGQGFSLHWYGDQEGE